MSILNAVPAVFTLTGSRTTLKLASAPLLELSEPKFVPPDPSALFVVVMPVMVASPPPVVGRKICPVVGVWLSGRIWIAVV